MDPGKGYYEYAKYYVNKNGYNIAIRFMEKSAENGHQEAVDYLDINKMTGVDINRCKVLEQSRDDEKVLLAYEKQLVYYKKHKDSKNVKKYSAKQIQLTSKMKKTEKQEDQ